MARPDGKTKPGTRHMSTGSEQEKGMNMSEAKVLDPASGGRMMYFDKADRRVLFGDIRDESWELCDGRRFDVHPDQRMDYRELPFPDGTYRLVVFDPPHLEHGGDKSYMVRKYGRLTAGWRDDLSRGFSECFRVMQPGGRADLQMERDADTAVPGPRLHPAQAPVREPAAQADRHALDRVDQGGRGVRYVSLFSGIEAASVAWGPLGWVPVRLRTGRHQIRKEPVERKHQVMRMPTRKEKGGTHAN